MNLDEFNAEPDNELTTELLTCADVPWWAESIVDERPFDDVDQLLKFADEKARDFTPANVERALAAHPRIGERKTGADTEAAWSRQEQAAAATPDEQIAADLAAANVAYEERFGRVFLICATGLSAEQILSAVHERLGNDDDTEVAVVADELRKIAVLRLGKLVR